MQQTKADTLESMDWGEACHQSHQCSFCYRVLTIVLISYQHLASYRPLENGIAAQTKRKRTQIATATPTTTTTTATLFQTFINGNIFTHFSKTNQQIGALCGSSAVDTQSKPKPGMGLRTWTGDCSRCQSQNRSPLLLVLLLFPCLLLHPSSSFCLPRACVLFCRHLDNNSHD